MQKKVVVFKDNSLISKTRERTEVKIHTPACAFHWVSFYLAQLLKLNRNGSLSSTLFLF